MKPKPLTEELNLEKEIVEKIELQEGKVLPEHVERFLAMRNWKEINPPPEYYTFAYKPNATYCAELIRDLSVEIIRIKKKLGMIK
jgi:hypothetical protein